MPECRDRSSLVRASRGSSPQAFTLTGVERNPGMEYTQGLLVMVAPGSAES